MSRGTLAAMGWHYTIEEYVKLEEQSPLKHEYLNGEIRVMGGVSGVSMGGGTLEQARLGAMVARLLGNQVAGTSCVVYSSDARIRAEVSDLVTYADVTVSCGPPQLDPSDRCAMRNPTVVVEVTSPSSEAYDRGGKLEHYKTIASLRAVVFVSHREHSIEVHRRCDDDTWSVVRGGAGERVAIEDIGCELDVDAVYRDPSALS